MKEYTLKTVPTAGAVEPKNNNKAAKAKRILVGVDVHLRGYQAGRKIDNSAIGVVWMRYASERDRSKLTKQLRIQRPVP